ncbi:MAG: GTPase HflX [Rhodobiaceae bacterium]|nr:GTPase HflX [Rhodobiaceae bacterium]MCC0062341.1 GTPase HflX [Rhodobiaceae bacterium]
MQSGDARKHGVSGQQGQGEGPREPTRAFVVVPVIQDRAGDAAPDKRDDEARLSEAVGLALAIDLDIADAGIVKIKSPRPATLMGSGKVEEIAARIRIADVGLVVVDAPLTPIQQRNLEKEWSAKVIDRTGLILEIFGRRAQTNEGRLQVELAHLTYQKSRLVRSWTHLERQRGGFGFLGGPGETQIEADRRLIQERITRIRKELDAVRRHRALHRKGRARVPYPSVALVGYTNAGKSTLFNRLTQAGVVAQDMLFATLDPTVRAVTLPHGRQITLSDTVGFISDLPTDLVAAFRATLEEVIEADLILHVRDISHIDSAAQSADVLLVLNELGLGESPANLIEVWNKLDLLPADERAGMLTRITHVQSSEGSNAGPIAVSALTGEGIDTLLDAIETWFATESSMRHLELDASDGAALNWIYENCEVMSRGEVSEKGGIPLTVRVPSSRLAGFEKRFGALATGIPPAPITP